MAQWRKSQLTKAKTLSENPLRKKKCVECGSQKWACFSDDGGKTWYCWGHRKGATPEERKKEDDKQKKPYIKGQIFRANVQRKRHGRAYNPPSSEFDWFFD